LKLKQIASKMRSVGANYCLDFRSIVLAVCFLFILDVIWGGAMHSSYNIRGLFAFVVLFQLRGIVRRKHNIPGGDCNDCCVSFWCAPCAITQIVGQLWKNPEEVPGCSCNEDAAQLA
jgi:Cys-rich protein (TIGR01571 family)